MIGDNCGVSLMEHLHQPTLPLLAVRTFFARSGLRAATCCCRQRRRCVEAQGVVSWLASKGAAVDERALRLCLFRHQTSQRTRLASHR